MSGVLGVALVAAGALSLGVLPGRSGLLFGAAMWLTGLLLGGYSLVRLRRRSSHVRAADLSEVEARWDVRRLWGCMAIVLAFLTWKSAQGLWLIAVGEGDGLNRLMLAGGPLVCGVVMMKVAGVGGGPETPSDDAKLRRRTALSIGAWATAACAMMVAALWFWRPEIGAASVPAALFVVTAITALRVQFSERARAR